jgi:hypothetical protein
MMIDRSSLLVGTVVSVMLAAACGDSSSTGSGGAGTTTGTTTATTGSATSGSTTSGTTTSTGTGNACADANEPDETIDSPAFFNDAGSGLSICDHTGLSMQGSLKDAADVDFYRGYTTMQSGCTPAPTLTVSGLTGAAKVCFYLQDDTSPTVLGCPNGTTKETASMGYTGCCETASPGAPTVITLTNIADLNATGANTQFAVALSASAGGGCDPYQLNVHF